MKFAAPEPNLLAGGLSDTSTPTPVVRCIGGDVVSVDERQQHQDRHQAKTGAGDIVTMFSDADGGKAGEAIPLAEKRVAQHLAELAEEETEKR